MILHHVIHAINTRNGNSYSTINRNNKQKQYGDLYSGGAQLEP